MKSKFDQPHGEAFETITQTVYSTQVLVYYYQLLKQDMFKLKPIQLTIILVSEKCNDYNPVYQPLYLIIKEPMHTASEAYKECVLAYRYKTQI